MKKFILLISAVLLSVAMHATVETMDVDWTLEAGGVANNTFTVDAWSSGSKWGWLTGADEYEQLVVEVADHDYDIMVSINCSDGSADHETKAIMRAGTNSVGVDITASILHSVEVKNFSANNGVTITVNDIYLRRAVGTKKTKTLWSGSEVFEDFKTWGTEIILDQTNFADIHAGDILEINYTLDEHSFHQFKIQASWEGYFPEFLGTLDSYNQYNINTNANANQVRFTIMSATDIDKLQTKGGIHVNAKYLTVTSIKLIHHETLWQGEQEVTSGWSGYQQIDASKLTGLKVGNIIAVRVSALTAGGQVFLQYNNGSWTNFEPTVNYVFSGSDEAPMVVEIPVTYKLERQLRGNKLIVKGASFTMTDIFIKEGTPVNTVAEYLNVTEAGMATYVLPFAVPSLPAGVKAYNLTNDGSEEIVATPLNALTADKPVLIIAGEGEYEFVSEAGASDDVIGKTDTYTNGALVGTYVGINPIPASSGSTYNYLLQNGVDGVAFYQVTTSDCFIGAYRAYLSCSYNSLASAGAPMRMVFRPEVPTTVESNQQSVVSVQKVLREGQLYLMYNGTMYNVQGQLVK